jgi:hypothetical protein
VEKYIPVKLAGVLRRKLEKKMPYWQAAAMKEVPFIISAP